MIYETSSCTVCDYIWDRTVVVRRYSVNSPSFWSIH